MLQRIYKKLRSEKANTLIENVIILPLIIIVIYFMILASFVIHDHSTLDAAAKRGTIYAARCVSDPNYPMILQQSGHQSGTLDTNVTALTADSFNGVGDNIKPYRYLVMNTADIRDDTVNEVYNIIQQTKIPWREIETGDIVVKIDNKIIYQNVEVSITARYPLPQIFGNFGLPTEFNYTVSAVTAVNDPDEFIRNVDLIVDVCAAIDQKTGGNIQKVLAKLNDMGTKLTQFLSGEKGIGGSGGTGTPPAGGSGGENEGNYIADAGDNAGGDDNDTEAGEGGATGGLGFVPADQGEDEKPQESSDALEGGTTEGEEVTPQQLRDAMVARFGQGTVDAVSEGVDTSTWTEYDWQFYITEYLQNGSLPGDWDVPIPVPKPSSTPEPDTINEVDTESYTVDDFLEEMSKLPHANISEAKKEEIISVPRGEKPDPSSYMSNSEIAEHLALFDEGVVKIQSREAYEKALQSYGGDIGDPDTGTFVLPKSVVDKAIKASNGDPRVLEKLLKLDEGYLGDSPIIVDILNPSNIRVPSGNEAGAWPEYWIPGGYTGGGVPEAVVDQIKSGDYTVSDVYSN